MQTTPPLHVANWVTYERKLSHFIIFHTRPRQVSRNALDHYVAVTSLDTSFQPPPPPPVGLEELVRRQSPHPLLARHVCVWQGSWGRGPLPP